MDIKVKKELNITMSSEEATELTKAITNIYPILSQDNKEDLEILSHFKDKIILTLCND